METVEKDTRVLDEDREEMDQHDSDIIFQLFCQFCGDSFHSFFSLDEHIKTEHDEIDVPNEISLENENALSGKSQQREVVSKWSDSKTVKKESSVSESTCNSGVLHKCQFCDETFHNRNDLEQHIEVGHDPFEAPEDRKAATIIKIDRNRFICPFCDNLFTKRIEVLQHIKKSHRHDKRKSVHNEAMGDDDIEPDYSIEKTVEPMSDIYQCPYCSLLTRYRGALKRHLKRIHPSVYQPDDLKNINKYLLDSDNVTTDIINSIKTSDCSNLDISKVSSYFQCPFCSFKCTHKSNMTRHLNSNRHIEETKRGMVSAVEVSDLRIKCEEKSSDIEMDSSPSFKTENETRSKNVRNNENVHIVREVNLLQERTVSTEAVAEGLEQNNDIQAECDSVKAGKNVKQKLKFDSDSAPAKEPATNCIPVMYKLPTQPVVKLEIMKLPIKLPDELKRSTRMPIDQSLSNSVKTYRNTRSMKGQEAKDQTADISVSKRNKSVAGRRVSESVSVKMNSSEQSLNATKHNRNKIEILQKTDSGENKCPHCDFKCKRESALRFHINFNHKNDKPSESSKPHKTMYKNDERSKNAASTEVKLSVLNTKQDLKKSTRFQSPVELSKSVGRKDSKKRHLEDIEIMEKSDEGTGKKKFKGDKNTAVSKSEERTQDKHAKKCVADKEGPVDKSEAEGITQRKEMLKSMAIHSDGDDVYNDANCERGTENDKVNNSRLVTDQGQISENEQDVDDIDDKDEQESETDEDLEDISYVCPFCNGRFKRLKSVRKHIMGSHPVENLSSAQIETMIEENESLHTTPKQRRIAKQNDQCFKCPYCQKYSHWIKTIKGHVQTVHKDKEFKEDAVEVVESADIPSTGGDNDGIFYSCSVCESKFKWFKAAKRHISTLHLKENSSDAQVYVHVDSDKEENLQTERKENTEDLLYKCPYCEQVLQWLKSMKRHIQTLHPDKPYNPRDIKVFEGEQDLLDAGNRDAELGALFGCPKCSMKFKFLKSAIHHVATVHADNKSLDLGSHKDKENKGQNSDYITTKVYKCPYCDKRIEWLKSMKRHINVFHKNKTFNKEDILVVDKDELQSSSTKERFQCPFCSLQLQWKNSIIRHIKKYHENKSFDNAADDIKPVSDSVMLERYLCPYCPLQFRWKHSVARHIGRFHQDKIDDFSVDKIESMVIDSPNIPDDTGATDTIIVVKEGTSDEVSPSDSALAEPEDVDGIEDKLFCNGDDMEIDVQGSQLVENVFEEDNKLKSHCCTKCMKTFSSYAALWKHNMMCHNIRGKRFKCRTCPQIFVFKHLRDKHEEKHSDENRFVYCCDQDGCEKRYTERKALYRHLKTNHGEADPAARLRTKKEKKKYYCEECNIEFNKPSSHWRHNLRLHKDKAKPHTCLNCNKAFLFAHELKDHMFVHIHHADIACPVVNCDFKTKKLKYLSKHMSNQHGVKVDIKSLGEQVLSQEQLTSREMLELLSQGKAIQESSISEGGAAVEHVDTVEPDKQIEMLDASASSGVDSSKGTATDPMNTEHIDKSGTDPLDVGQSSSDNAVIVTKKTAPNAFYKCKSCTDKFLTHRHLITHRIRHHPEDLASYRCDQCSKSFFTNYDLNEHKAYKHPSGKDHVCDVCGKSFSTLSAFHKHQQRHKQEPVNVDPQQGEVICDLCGLSLRFKASLKTHMQRVHPEKMKCSCRICSGTDLSVQGAKDTNVPFCDVCSQSFCKKVYLESHMRAVHNTTGRHTCNFCQEKFSNLNQKNMHMHQMHTVVREPEATEDSEVGQISALNDDTQVIEISNDDQSGPKFLPKLSEQGMKAVTKELKIYTEESKKHWKCLLCGQCFSKVKYFNLHVRRTHVRPEHQPYRCKVCSAGFVRVGEFRKHTRSHSGFRPLKCKICHKSFKQQAHLKEHSLIHTDARQYKCEICQGRFKQRGALLAHVVKHDKLKPFKCQFCGQGFTVRGALSKHMQKYFGNGDINTYLCHICHKTFTHYPLLLKHIHSHPGPNPFNCEVCGQAFAAYSSLYFHKVKEKHFRDEDFETALPKKYGRKGMEVSLAVSSLTVDDGQPDTVSNDLQLENNNLADRNVTDNGSDETAVEIVIESVENAESTTAFEVEGHADEELLAIAKQLTEMSSYPGNEVFIEEVESDVRNDEEEKIMMNMLDADDDIKSNLERALLSKPDAIPGQSETKYNLPEKTYVQIFQYVDEHGIPIENVDENGVPIQHVSENVIPVEQIVECSVPVQHTDEKNISLENGEGHDPINPQMDAQDGVTIQKVNGNDLTGQQIDGSDVSTKNTNAKYISDQEIDESGISVQQIDERSIQIQDVEETGKHMEGGDEKGIPVQLAQEENIPAENSDKIGVHLKHVDQDGVPIQFVDEKGNPIEPVDENGILIQNVEENVPSEQRFEDHGSKIFIGEGRETEGTQSDDAKNYGIEIEQQTVDVGNNQMSSNEVVSNTDNEISQATSEEELQSDNQIFVVDSSIQEIIVFNNEIQEANSDDRLENTNEKQVLPGKSGSSASIIVGATKDELTDSNIHEIRAEQSASLSSEFVEIDSHSLAGQIETSVSKPEHNITGVTVVPSSEQEPAQEILATTTESLVADHDVPAVLQTVEHIYRTYESEHGEQGDIIEHNYTEMVENEGAHSLIPVDFTDPQTAEATVPMYVFKKADGSLIYFSVNRESEGNSELLNADFVTNDNLEKEDIRDDSTLEMAKILKSVADGSITDQEQMQETGVGDKEKHMQTDGAETETENNQKFLVIINDNAVLSSMRRIVREENSSEAKVVYVCSICQAILKTKKNLRDHLKRHNNKEDRPFGCQNCSKRFVTKTELARHERIHSNDRPCECDVCGKRFRQPGHLLTHKRTHTGEKPYSCFQCDARFTTSSLLKSHLVVHSDERKFQCNICKQSFKAVKDLRRHRAVHSGIVGNKKENTQSEANQDGKRTHICHYCGKAFLHLTNLQAHIAAEENLRPFKCDTCGQGFNSKGSLHVHSFTHKDAKPEICNVCGKAFKRPQSLKLHMQIHLNALKDDDGKLVQSAFPCPACNKQFNHRGALYYHIGVSPDCVAKGNVKAENMEDDASDLEKEEQLSVTLENQT